MSVFILSCIIIWLQCKALFKFLSSTTRTSIDFSLFVIIEFVSLSLFFRHSFVFLCFCHTAFERKNQHTPTILSHIIFYLFVAFGLSLSLFIHKHFLSAACAFLVVCFGPWFLYVLTVLSLSTSVCLFGFLFSIFLFLFLRVPFFSKINKKEENKLERSIYHHLFVFTNINRKDFLFFQIELSPTSIRLFISVYERRINKHSVRSRINWFSSLTFLFIGEKEAKKQGNEHSSSNAISTDR